MEVKHLEVGLCVSYREKWAKYTFI